MHTHTGKRVVVRVTHTHTHRERGWRVGVSAHLLVRAYEQLQSLPLKELVTHILAEELPGAACPVEALSSHIERILRAVGMMRRTACRGE